MLIKNFTKDLIIEEKHFNELSRIQKLELSIEYSVETEKYERVLTIFFGIVSKTSLLVISFRDIHQLNIKEIPSIDKDFIIEGFDIIDHANSQMENISFEIIDYENDTLHFFCRDIVIEENKIT